MDDIPYSEKQGCIFCGEKGRRSLYDCHKFKDADPTNRFQFLKSYWLCWLALYGVGAHGFEMRKYKNSKVVTDTFMMNWFVPLSIKVKKYFGSFVGQ